ncbi:MAG: DUF1919 domain-containing protein [Lutibacter sp.]|nr:DUF1919 domain-containing protein [Lutibacter sp.]
MIRKINVFIRRKFRRIFQNQLRKKDVLLLKNKKFVIIANNCWGGEIYSWFKRPYNSPFVGLYLHGPCFVKLLSNFNHYMSQELKFVNSTAYSAMIPNYPVAILDNVEIHFLHYKSEEEAREKWTRRTSRMLEESNLDNYFFKICDLNGGSESVLKKFHNLPFRNKVSFGVKDYTSLKDKNHIKIEESGKNEGLHVPNGVKLFKLTFLYFNIPGWLNN